jgi:hypothetical protein
MAAWPGSNGSVIGTNAVDEAVAEAAADVAAPVAPVLAVPVAPVLAVPAALAAAVGLEAAEVLDELLQPASSPIAAADTAATLSPSLTVPGDQRRRERTQRKSVMTLLPAPSPHS